MAGMTMTNYNRENATINWEKCNYSGSDSKEHKHGVIKQWQQHGHEVWWHYGH